MPTETKSYTPGAERAAHGLSTYLSTYPWYTTAIAEIISSETHDAEMLEALKAIVRQQRNNQTGGILIDEAEALIAKLEGR